LLRINQLPHKLDERIEAAVGETTTNGVY
jgi:hypothetical protein